MKTDMRRELARQPFEQKIRKVARLIQLAKKMNTASSRSGRIDDSNGHPQGEIRGPTKLVKAERAKAAAPRRKKSARPFG